ncbi:hypothetical protein EBO15_04275 [Actinomadura harenae]|uniref:Uncharacterized protein n=1 Tax=Actinomadura harenae TaxID=2483351 RepID=A0A3M2MDR3_9ACTN|nr:hypothetical protein EBO15_04275 [Actinomadura harenae]
MSRALAVPGARSPRRRRQRRRRCRRPWLWLWLRPCRCSCRGAGRWSGRPCPMWRRCGPRPR